MEEATQTPPFTVEMFNDATVAARPIHPDHLKDLQNRFAYHKPFSNQAEKYAYVRSALLTVAVALVKLVPKGKEQNMAITRLEETMFWANAAIARNEKEIVQETSMTTGPTPVKD